ncbi:neuromedin-U receptor 2-like [Oculina patagonica]
MSLTSNTTIYTFPNETAVDQQNSSACVYVDSTEEKISKVCAYCFILLGSFFGNIFIIIIVYKHRDLRKTINYFIVNMAVSDLVFPLMVIPVNIAELVTDSPHWRVSGILGSIFCKLVYFLCPVSLQVSVQSLVWIAFDRFVAVVFPMKLGLISTKIRRAAIVSTWIVAGLFNSPKLITRGLVAPPQNTFCFNPNRELIFTTQETISAYFWLRVILFNIAPLFLISFLYSAMAVSLKRQNKALADTAPNVQRYSLKKRRQAIQMAAVIVVLFYICVIPQTLRRLAPYLNWRPSCAFQNVFYFLALFMYFSSTIVNPVICLSFVGSYRRGLRNILCPCMRMPNSLMEKREQITLKRIKNLPDENYQPTSKETEIDEETLDTVL